MKKCIKNLFTYIQSTRQSSRGDIVRIAICTIIQHQLGFDDRTLTAQPNVTQFQSLMWNFGKAIQKLLLSWHFPLWRRFRCWVMNPTPSQRRCTTQGNASRMGVGSSADINFPSVSTLDNLDIFLLTYVATDCDTRMEFNVGF